MKNLLILLLTARPGLMLALRQTSAVCGGAATGRRLLYTANRFRRRLRSQALESDAGTRVAQAAGTGKPQTQGRLLTPNPRFEAKPFEYLQELELRIESLTNLGDGVARVDGWVVMVGRVVPGELVKAKVYRNHSVSDMPCSLPGLEHKLACFLRNRRWCQLGQMRTFSSSGGQRQDLTSFPATYVPMRVLT